MFVILLGLSVEKADQSYVDINRDNRGIDPPPKPVDASAPPLEISNESILILEVPPTREERRLPLKRKLLMQSEESVASGHEKRERISYD